MMLDIMMLNLWHSHNQQGDYHIEGRQYWER